MLFGMVSKLLFLINHQYPSFRAVLFRMVSKLQSGAERLWQCFRAVLFRMVLKYTYDIFGNVF